MEKVIYTVLSEQELSDLIDTSVRNALKDFYPAQPEEDVFLSQKEAAKFLGVSLVTLIKYKKEGLVTCKQMGKRYYYSKDCLINSMKEINTNRNSFFS